MYNRARDDCLLWNIRLVFYQYPYIKKTIVIYTEAIWLQSLKSNITDKYTVKKQQQIKRFFDSELLLQFKMTTK